MANVHAAIKQIRKDAKKREHNQAVLSELKTLWRKLSGFGKADAEQAQLLAHDLVSKWDRAVSGGMVPKGRADRKKARIALFLKKLSPSR
ncbi:MAG: 30S ribosomal protein S20 [Candidatus Omnitrophica bacterium]|nr:30S ribosomal protein S20 [Candidatus Omnitrophota bacterium]